MGKKGSRADLVLYWLERYMEGNIDDFDLTMSLSILFDIALHESSELARHLAVGFLADRAVVKIELEQMTAALDEDEEKGGWLS